MRHLKVLSLWILALVMSALTFAAIVLAQLSDKFAEIYGLFADLFVALLPLILLLFGIELFLTRVIKTEGIFTRIFKI